MTPLLGVDISSHNFETAIPTRLLAKLKRKGVAFIIARASIGTEIDKIFVESAKRIIGSGLQFGAYHYLDDGPSGTNQADVFLSQIDKAGCARGSLLLCDFEASVTNHPQWVQAKDWSKRVNAKVAGAIVGLYSSEANAVRVHNPDATPYFDYLWNAKYTDRENLDVPGITLPPTPPKAKYFGFRGAQLWQFGPMIVTAPSGTVLRLDGDAWYGSLAELQALTKPRPVPLPQRPNYAVGHNMALDAIAAAVSAFPAGVNVPTLPPGPAAPAGWDDGRADTLAALDDLRMTVGD